MNSLDNIISKIISDANEYKAVCEKQAENEYSDIVDTYRSEGEFSAASIISAAEKKDAEKVARAKSEILLEEKNLTLSLKKRLIERAFLGAAEKICALPKNEKLDFYLLLFNSAYDGGNYEVTFNKADRALLGAEFIAKAGNDKISLSDSYALISGGFVLKRGGIELNSSVETLIGEYRNTLERKVCEILFG